MIKINDDWIIDSDDNCYILKEDLHKCDKNGKKRYKVKGYYSGLSEAFNALIKEDTREMFTQGSYSLVEAVAALKNNKKKWEEIFKCLQ